MAFPTDIRLPTGSRYYTLIATKKTFNSNYDIVWSFEYKLPGSAISAPFNTYQVGFTTFLTNLISYILLTFYIVKYFFSIS